ncbi:hypothetical protein, partial [Fusobacterium ulcerans]|uniref:hypothetical protein n=1 Tax=Fusobacterium ulcerans TaxID=861 RepID=UPI002E772A96
DLKRGKMKRIIKKLIILLITIGFIYNCTSLRTITGSQNRKVLKAFKEAYPNENFYFIYGLDYKIDLSTSIRYRGIIYSDRLAAINYPGGLEVAFSDNINVYGEIYSYEKIFKRLDMNEPIKERIKELFGEKTTFQNNISFSDRGFESWKKYKGENLEDEEKFEAWNTIVNVFVDDINKIEENEEKYRKKVYELSKLIYNEMNIKTSLQVYFRDKSYFKNYEIVNNSVFKPFRKKEEVDTILKKIKNNEEITGKEELILINNFYRSLPNYDNVKYFTSQFKRNELKEENIIFRK